MKKYVVRVDDQFILDYEWDAESWEPTTFANVELTGDVDEAFVFYEGSDLLDEEVWRLYFSEDVDVSILEVRTVIV